MVIRGVAEPIELEFDTESEPLAVARIADLVRRCAYDDAVLRVKPAWLALELPPGSVGPSKAPIELRRIRHSKFSEGSIGWSWAMTPSDGRGEFFITFDRQDGLDSYYQEVGKITAGMAHLLAVRPPPSPKLVRRPLPPIVIESVRALEVAASA